MASLLALVLILGLVSLGSWQVQRLRWKLALMDRVEQGLVAAPVAAPGPGDWARLGTEDSYRRVVVQGVFDHRREACTQAVTELGPGCWVMTPLRTEAGWWLLINRGFVDSTHRNPTTRAIGQVAGAVQLEGLLRLSEPRGGFLRDNAPAADRWYSRDVAALAAARQLPANEVAPYFVDASTSVEGGPVGGLTVVRFHNHHLVYALTWFGLAGMVVAGVVLVVRRERRLQALH
jgi:surfeit locus 1 family protein